jgi:hypothetical protein
MLSKNGRLFILIAVIFNNINMLYIGIFLAGVYDDVL